MLFVIFTRYVNQNLCTCYLLKNNLLKTKMNHHLGTNCDIFPSSVEKIVETKTELVGEVSS